MGVSGSFRKLSQVIERYESDGGEIQHVEAQIPDRESKQGLNATLDVPISLCSKENSEAVTSPKAAEITDDGGLQVKLAPSVLPNLSEYVPEEISTVEKGVRVAEGGTVVMTITLTFGAEIERQHSDESTPCTMDSHASATSDVTENDEAGDTAPADERGATTTVAETDDPNGIDGQTGTLTEGTESPGDQTDGENELDGVRNADIPLYKDEECLQYLYDSFRTFEEMAQCIETSVSSETVRRYMIEADIHEPSTYDTVGETVAADESSATEDVGGAEDETDEQTDVGERAEGAQPSPGMESVQQRRTDESNPSESLSDIQLVADGIGLPDGLTIEDLVDAIESSMTVFDVQRELDLSKERTEELLKRLNLIDLVRCRLSHHSDQQVTQDEIVNRIRSSTMNN
ncbi:hypothetical protein [Halopelagius fulvigenes]|uniref:Helix-turn-helix domain-containing protein n=1 Tax=Halopelagius fulvigenes TaxID=1198324 RepID=A0ABD5TWD2_9EURY